MNTCLQGVLELVVDCYLERRNHIDQFEIDALRDASQQGIDAFNEICCNVFGIITGELYYAALEKISDMLQFQLELQTNTYHMSENQMILIFELIEDQKENAGILRRLCQQYECIPFLSLEKVLNTIQSLGDQIIIKLQHHICSTKQTQK